jgi:hypothetical protein
MMTQSMRCQHNTGQISRQKRQKEESSNESNEESNTKRRKTQNFVVGMPVTQEKRDNSPAITNVEPSLNQETTSSDELLELLASWQ